MIFQIQVLLAIFNIKRFSGMLSWKTVTYKLLREALYSELERRSYWRTRLWATTSLAVNGAVHISDYPRAYQLQLGKTFYADTFSLLSKILKKNSLWKTLFFIFINLLQYHYFLKTLIRKKYFFYIFKYVKNDIFYLPINYLFTENRGLFFKNNKKNK